MPNKWAALLRGPPFPYAAKYQLSVPSVEQIVTNASHANLIIEQIKTARIGGDFWAARPDLPADCRTLAIPRSRAQAKTVRAETVEPLAFWCSRAIATPTISGPCDAWHLFDQVDHIWLDKDDPLALLARIAGKTIQYFGNETPPTNGSLAADVTAQLIARRRYLNPFSNSDETIDECIVRLAFWRALIDANRSLDSVVGIASWKRKTTAALLWNGTAPVKFSRPTSAFLMKASAANNLAVWKSRVSRTYLTRLESSRVQICEVEDGFLRSKGLGADCVPPLSIVVDRQGIYFDATGPSDLEALIEQNGFSAELCARACALQAIIIHSDISKYEVGGTVLARPSGEKHHILVTGQVEDDRSILTGSPIVQSNLELLRRARMRSPDAHIIYKPHPDVEAGHRKGLVLDLAALQYADQVVRDASINSLLKLVDEVECITSLAGFEALLRGKKVTTHGLPFYAGWGLTNDLCPIPARRSARPTLAELVAATLLLYPRYLDPMTGLPCPPEVLIERLTHGTQRQNGLLVSLRRLQGGLMRLWRK